MENRQNYVFLSLKDALCCINMKVNLIAAVVEFGIPKQGKQKDYACTLKVMDSSCHDRGIHVNIFAESKEKLPCAKSLGDVICLKRVVMRIHNEEVSVVFNKNFSAFAMFRGKPCKDCVPYQVSSNFSITVSEKGFVAQLRTWLADHPFYASVNDLLQLREIKMGEYFDLVCKILHACEVPGDGWMLYVWDGTDCPPNDFHLEPDAQSEALYPLQVEPVPLSRNVLCTFPSVGTVLRVIADRSFEELTGQWVKFCNIMCQVQLGHWKGVLMPWSRLFRLSDEDEVAKNLQRYDKERRSSNLNCLPLSCFPWPSRITEVDHERAIFSTLMDVITHNEVTFKYKCIVRVVVTCPWPVEQFCSTVTGKYRIRFTVEDPTARIRVGLFDEDAEKFFGGYPSKHVLKTKMNKLLGIADEREQTSRNPPWVQVCLLSFYSDKNDKWGSRRYRIFDTTLVA